MSEKKDLTNIFDLPKEATAQTSDGMPSADEFAITLAPPSLEGLGDLDQPMVPDYTLPPPSDEALQAASGEAPPSEDAFAVTESAPETASDPVSDPAASFASGDDLSASNVMPHSSDDAPANPLGDFSSGFGVSLDEVKEPTALVAVTDPTATFQAQEIVTEPLPAAEPPPSVAAISAGLEAVKKYSESMSPAPADVAAGVPYTLMIEGKLKPHERERFSDLVTRGGFGIREVELEPQFLADRILIPRISEYAGVTLVQALRGAHVKIRLGPSDQVFTSREGYDETTLLTRDRAPDFVETDALVHAAEQLPVTSESSLPDNRSFEFIDSLHLAVNLKPDQVSGAGNDIFEATLEALKRSLKYRAYHKGASAIIRFSWQLIPVSGYQSYKLVVQGTAIKVPG